MTSLYCQCPRCITNQLWLCILQHLGLCNICVVVARNWLQLLIGHDARELYGYVNGLQKNWTEDLVKFPFGLRTLSSFL